LTSKKLRCLSKKKGGQGVLVGGNLILTAAHCVTYTLTGAMVLGEYFVEKIKTKDGAELEVCPWAVEPMSDIAVLGALDEQECSDKGKAFEVFCDQTKPVYLTVPYLSSCHDRMCSIGQEWIFSP